MKSTSTINPATIENTKDLLIKVCTPIIDQVAIGLDLGHFKHFVNHFK